MCVIVDANLASVVFSRPTLQDFYLLIEWVSSPQKDGKLVVGGLLFRELMGDDEDEEQKDKRYKGIDAARRFIRVLGQAGRVRFIPKTVVDQETKHIRDLCKSDDPHVIALARVSGARILCSRDTTLHKDFTDPSLINKPRGHIYQTDAHSHLLTRYGHTKACRRSMNI